MPGSPKPHTAQACIQSWQLDRAHEFVVEEFGSPICKNADQVAHKIGNLGLQISKGGPFPQYKHGVWNWDDCVAEA